METNDRLEYFKIKNACYDIYLNYYDALNNEDAMEIIKN